MTRGAEGCRSKCAQNHQEGFFLVTLLFLLNCCFLGQRDTVRNDYLSLVLIFNLKSRLFDIQPQKLEKIKFGMAPKTLLNKGDTDAARI